MKALEASGYTVVHKLIWTQQLPKCNNIYFISLLSSPVLFSPLPSSFCWSSLLFLFLLLSSLLVGSFLIKKAHFYLFDRFCCVCLLFSSL